MSHTTITTESSWSRDASVPREQLALVITWSADHPERVGEVVFVPHHTSRATATLGRGDDDALSLRASPWRQRPGRNHPQGPLTERRLSRDQLTLRAEGTTGVQIERIGRCPMLHNGIEVDRARVVPGDTITLRKAIQFLCVTRPQVLELNDDLPQALIPGFGAPDAAGLVGETPAMWALRSRIAFVARTTPHALIVGPSGAGKELVAQAIHQQSARGERPLISRNAATIPDGLVDAELFGNVRDYPNPGMRDRRGLFGEAHRSTLFLDEIGEIATSVQAHLLRAMDEGEVFRLGDDHPHTVDVRVLAATNRPPSALKHDLLARFKLQVLVPDLNERKADIPLIAHHLLHRIAQQDPGTAERFFHDGQPRIHPGLMRHLLRRTYRVHVRELEALLWQSIAESPDDQLERPSGMDVTPQAQAPGSPAREVDVRDLTAEAIQDALDANRGRIKETWQALGLKNRFQLIRLIKKHGLRKS